jgi:serine/threonine protein kinase
MPEPRGTNDSRPADTSAPAASSSLSSSPPSPHYRTSNLDRLDAALQDDPTASGTSDAHALRSIGRYRILERIGEGGMGAVYRAEQRSPFERIVALKLIRPGWDTPEIIRRFESERQALAWMDHPNIAKVLDAGADPVSGRPYFVMEYVPGLPITKFCDEHRLTNRQRLELFVQVCEAVAHAHQKMMVHRDIKPSNVLVRAEESGRADFGELSRASTGVVKVIDFGVAKALVPSSAERAATLLTEVGQIVGTLDYMSPEQARSGGSAGDDIDTRSDIYSMGVLLYELLTGALPFDPQKLRSGGLSGTERMICDVEPPPPSTRFFELGEQTVQIAQRRQTQPHELQRELKTELEWIPLKAMRKERSQRYATAAEFAEDVRNYLGGRPLRAAPESRLYRARKFLWRNRIAVAVCALIALLLIGGIAGTTWQARRARQQQRLAEERFDDIRNLASDLIFDIHSDVVKLPGSQPAVDKLLKVAIEYLQKLRAESSNNFQIVRDAAFGYAKLGDIQGNQYGNNKGDMNAALASYQKSFELAQRALTMRPNDADALRALGGAETKLADLAFFRADYQTALQRYSAALQHMQQSSAQRPGELSSRARVIAAAHRVATVKEATRNTAEALKEYDGIVDQARQLVRDFPDEREPLELLANAQQWSYELRLRAGDLDAALAGTAEAVALREKVAAADPENVEAQVNVAVALQMLARCQDFRGKLQEAMTTQKRSTELVGRLVQKDPANARVRSLSGNAQLRFAELAAKSDHLDDAALSYDAAVKTFRDALKDNPSDRQAFRLLNYSLSAYGTLLANQKRFPESIALQREAIALLEAAADAEPNNAVLAGGLAYTQAQLAQTLLDSGNAGDAVAPLRRAIEIDERIFASDPANAQIAWNLVDTRTVLGDALLTTGSAGEAKEKYTQARELAVSLQQKKMQSPEQGMLEKIEAKLAALSHPTTEPAATTRTAP